MNPEPNPEPLLDIGRARHVRGRNFEIRISPAERLRSARRVPQAVVKVTSYATGKARVIRHLRYISRNGKLTLETDTGQELTTEEDQRMLVEDWGSDFDTRPRSRDAVAIVFSLPPGSKVEALRVSVRTTLARSFPNNEWVFGIHEDRNHPHAHALVKMRGRESSKKLRINKPELYRLRDTFAKAAREQGIRLAASSRASRGVGPKGERQAVYHLRRKGVVIKADHEVTREAVADKPGMKPWEKAMAARNQLEKEAYLLCARQFRTTASEKSGAEREKLLQAAGDLERYSRNLAKPRSRRQELLEQAKETMPHQGGSAEKNRGQDGLEMDR
jgi:hypothetical protein